MVDLTAISSAATGFKAAMGIAKGIQSLTTSTEVRQKTSELLDAVLDGRTKLLEASETQAALLERIKQLEDQIAHFENWDCEKQRYQLKAFDTGAFAYTHKPVWRTASHLYGFVKHASRSVTSHSFSSARRFRLLLDQVAPRMRVGLAITVMPRFLSDEIEGPVRPWTWRRVDLEKACGLADEPRKRSPTLRRVQQVQHVLGTAERACHASSPVIGARSDTAIASSSAAIRSAQLARSRLAGLSCAARLARALRPLTASRPSRERSCAGIPTR
jgi:hypothetical protein